MNEPRYIDATALDARVCDSMNLSTNPDPVLKLMQIHDHKLFRAMIAEAPTVEMTPTIPAKWEDSRAVVSIDPCTGDVEVADCYRCSMCGTDFRKTIKKYKFCPNCGLPME